MVRFAATFLLLAWAGTFHPNGALALVLSVPNAPVAINVPIEITWTREANDPFPFGIMVKNMQDESVIGLIKVNNGGAETTTGTVSLQVDVAGQILLTPVDQILLGAKTPPQPIAAGVQVAVVESTASSVPPTAQSSTFSQSTATREQSSTRQEQPTSTTTPLSPTSSPTSLSSPTISFTLPSEISRSVSVTTTLSTPLTPGRFLPTESFSFEGSLPSSQVSTATGGLTTRKKISIAAAVVGSIIGFLVCVLLLLHCQRRANRKRVDDFSLTWSRRRRSITKSVLDFQSSSAVSSFSAGVRDLEKTGPSQTEMQMVENNGSYSYPAANGTAETHHRGPSRDRALPPITIPQTYLTPPNHRPNVPGPLALANPDSSPQNSWNSSYGSVLSDDVTSRHGIMINIDAPTPTSSHSMLPYTSPSPTTPPTPNTPSSATTTSISSPITPPGQGQAPSKKMREVLEIQAQRKLMRDEQLQRAKMQAFARRPQLGNVGDGERDSWAMILNEEPLPRYVSPAASVKWLSSSS